MVFSRREGGHVSSLTPQQRRPRSPLEPILRLVFYFVVLGFGCSFLGLLMLLLIVIWGRTPAQVTSFQVDVGLMTAFSIPFAALTVLVTLAFIVFVDKQPSYSLGFNCWGSWARELWFGILLGLSAAALVFGISYAMGWIRITGSVSQSGSANAVSTFLQALLLMAGVATAEETMARGYVLRTLKWGYGTLAALAASSALFGVFHFMNPGAAVPGLVGTAAAGLVLGYAYLATERLWLPIAVHFGWNLCLGPIFGFRVSGLDFDSWIEHVTAGSTLWTGGGFGPEAGVLSVGAYALVAVGIWWFRRTFYVHDTHAPAGA